jgi:hypothetical protein
MNEAALMHVLRTSGEVRRILEHDFDFRPVPIGGKSALFHSQDGGSYELAGTDASGGEFVLCGSRDLPERPFLYVSSEGGAGVLARSLQNGLAVIIALPFWRDCLKFSGNGQLAEMKRVVPLAESDLAAATSQIDSKRKTLRDHLGISPIPDAVRELHSSLIQLSSLYPAFAPDGWPYGTLCGKFTEVLPNC